MKPLSDWPRNNVTFVFTDIEGSTAMTHILEATEGAGVYERALRDPQRERLFRHFGALEISVPEVREVSRAGDGHFFVFQSVDEAIAAAVAFQKEQHANPITYKEHTVRVRIGIHRSFKEREPKLEAGGLVEYPGDDTNFAARVASQGVGGQLLLSENAYQNSGGVAGLGSKPAVAWKWRRFKGFPDPQTVWEVFSYPEQESIEPGTRFFPAFYRGEKNRYVSRPTQEAAVFQVLQSRENRVAVIRAEGGMGKTRLAVACGVQAMDLYPDGVFFVSLARLPEEVDRVQADADFLVARVLEGLPESIRQRWGIPVGVPVTMESLIHTLREREILLILDNYESVDDKVARAFLGKLADTRVRLLITSRVWPDVLTLGKAIWLDKGMALEEAQALFLERAQQVHEWGSDYTIPESECVYRDRILELTAYIPLAIELAAAHVRHASLEDIAKSIQNTPFDFMLAAASHWDDEMAYERHRSMTRTLDWSFALLSEEMRRGFAAASLFGGSFTKEMLCTVGEIEEAVLYCLVDDSLVRRDSTTNRYYLHHLTRAYATMVLLGDKVKVDNSEESKPEHRPEREDAKDIQTRFVDTYLEFLRKHHNTNSKIVYIFHDSLETTRVLLEEQENIPAVATVASHLERSDELVWFGRYGDVLQRIGYWSEALVLYAQLQVLYRESNNQKSVAWMLHETANVYYSQGRWDDAIRAYEQSLVIKREIGNRQGEAASLHGVANVYNKQGRWDDAIRAYEQSLAIKREIGDRQGEAASLHGVANVYNKQGRWDDAIRAYEQSLAIEREMGNRQGEAASLHGVANVYNKQGRWDNAIRAYEQSGSLYRDLGDRQGEAASLHGVANVYVNQGRWDDAIRAYEQSLVIEREMGNRQGEAASLHGVANVYVNQGRWDDAIRAYEQSGSLYHNLGDRQGEAASLHGVANVYVKQGRWDDAIRAYEQSGSLYRDLGDRQGEAASLHGVANVYVNQGRWDDAIRAYEQSLVIEREMGNRHGEAITITSMGNIYLAQGKRDKAISAYREGMIRLEALGDVPNAKTAKRLLESALSQSTSGSASPTKTGTSPKNQTAITTKPKSPLARAWAWLTKGRE